MSIAGAILNPNFLLDSYDLDKLKEHFKPLLDSMNEDLESVRKKNENYWLKLEDGKEGVIVTATTGAYLVLCADGEIRSINREQRELGRIK